jgi:anaerobic magnesium-protoporphyrin IX monomethyl ester cyclase
MKVVIAFCSAWGIDTPPLGVASLYSYLKKDFSIQIYDFNVALQKIISKVNFYFLNTISLLYYMSRSKYLYKLSGLYNNYINDWTNEIIKIKPKVVCFSCYQSNLLMSLRLAENIKKNDEKIKIIFGGPSCDRVILGEFIIKCSSVDYVVTGEGEVVLNELLHRIEHNRRVDIKGVLFKSDKKIIYAGDAPPIKNLDRLPFPDFSIFDLNQYSTKVLPISFSRRCPYNCAYCNVGKFWKKYRYKSSARIIEEIVHIKDTYGVNQFEVVDSTVNGNHELFNEVCDKLINLKFPIYWTGFTHFDVHLTNSFLKKLRKSGFCVAMYGIESGSPKVLKKMGKMSNIILIQKMIQNTYKADIKICSTWIVGFPNETVFDFLSTLKFIWKNRKYLGQYIAVANPCTIIPGTDLYHNPNHYGIKNPNKKYTWKSNNSFYIKRLIFYTIFRIYSKSLNILYQDKPENK